MKTCPNCGAENLQTATSCRMCATPIETPQDLLGIRADMPLSDRIPSTNIISGPEPEKRRAPDSTYAGHLICPTCQAVNEADWVFCQECGASLSGLEKSSGLPASDSGSTARIGGSPSSESGSTSQDQERKQPPSDPKSTPRSLEDRAVICPSCASVQPAAGDYCSSCGLRLRVVPELPDAVGTAATGAVLELITDGGEVGETYPLESSVTLIGRSDGDVVFPHDGYMSARHARVVEREGKYFLIDDGSRNGTFIKIKREARLQPGDMFLVGKQVFRFNRPS